MAFERARGLAEAMTVGQMNLVQGSSSDLIYTFTTDADPLWNSFLNGAYGLAKVDHTFTNAEAMVSNIAWNIGGDDKWDICLADKTLVASGGPTTFRYVWLVHYISTRLLGFWDYGPDLITVNAGQALKLEPNDANNRVFSIP